MIAVRKSVAFIVLVCAVLGSWASQPGGAAPAPSDENLAQVVGCTGTCVLTGRVSFKHPTWGRSDLVLSGDSMSCGTGSLALVSRDRKVRWRHDVGGLGCLTVAREGLDAASHIFVAYTSGAGVNSRGLIVLEPTADGFADFESLPATESYRYGVFAGAVAEPVDVDGDGIAEIQTGASDCKPDCAGGKVVRTTFVWNGTGFEPSDDEHLRIVSLGDSFSSGEGNPPFDSGTDQETNRCHRSDRGWPRLIGVASSAHLACSGAVVDDYYNARFGRSAPDDISQFDRLIDTIASEPADVVTLTLGGNDVGFGAILGDCVVRECLRHPEDNRAAIDRAVGTLQPVYQTLRAVVGAETQVLVVGYPRLFPKDIKKTTRCGWLEPFELARANELQYILDERMAAAAAAEGVAYLSVLDALDGHELCSQEPWIKELSRDCLRGSSRPLCGHAVEDDTRHGQRALADAVAEWLDANVVPRTESVGSPADAMQRYVEGRGQGERFIGGCEVATPDDDTNVCLLQTLEESSNRVVYKWGYPYSEHSGRAVVERIDGTWEVTEFTDDPVVEL